ncbi:hypothetical protein RU61_03233 [Salmonella enterica subsp. enterica serovar Derby]|nr:hypothetical protein RU61_03233 [Salmonella enterica subsp. enterica serovar Derby]
MSITKPGVTLLKIFLQALISLIRQRLLCTQHTRRHRAIAEQSGPVLFGRCRQRYCLAGIGDGIQPHQSVQRQRAHMPDILLAQYIRGAIRECDLIDRLPATVKLRHHTTGIDGQQFSHFAKCFHFVGIKVAPQAQTGDHQLPELLRRHIAIGMRGDQLMQTFASGSLFQAAVQVIQVAGQHPDRLCQHSDAGKNRRQSHGPLTADLLSGIGVV